MKFEQDKFYRDRRTLNTDLYILEIIDECYDFTILRGVFVDRSHEVPSEEPSNLTIKRNKYNNWSELK
jgi:hypothetical protein